MNEYQEIFPETGDTGINNQKTRTSFLPGLVGQYEISARKAIFNNNRLPQRVRKKFSVQTNDEGTVFIRRRRQRKKQLFGILSEKKAQE